MKKSPTMRNESDINELISESRLGGPSYPPRYRNQPCRIVEFADMASIEGRAAAWLAADKNETHN